MLTVRKAWTCCFQLGFQESKRNSQPIIRTPGISTIRSNLVFPKVTNHSQHFISYQTPTWTEPRITVLELEERYVSTSPRPEVSGLYTGNGI